MDNIRRGAWIANSVKKLTSIRVSAPELIEFEATEQAGKAGMLLSRLTTESSEIVPAAKAKAFARESGITAGEYKQVLELLKSQGQVDYAVNERGQPEEIETYTFSVRDVLKTTAKVFDDLGPSSVEMGSLVSMEETFNLPRTEEELVEKLTKEISEKDASLVLKLQSNLGLVKTSDTQDERVYYNEYAFADDPSKIIAALKGLDESNRQSVNDILYQVNETPGILYESLSKSFPTPLLQMMEGVGLIDSMPVTSRFGEATFVTAPQLKGLGADAMLTADIFHKSKALLNCLRFGQFKSVRQRGQIHTSDKMLNIVRKLNRGEEVGPCTAIGQDYVMLERLGVIRTIPHQDGMYFMQLRQKEVGHLVLQMLQDKMANPSLDGELHKLLAAQPESFELPEDHRSKLIARQPKAVSEVTGKLMRAIRSGTGRNL